ncbi:hypothetical protein SAMN05519104_6951 [Rhizobiales bacterium GAS188]|nr:hypothetical protein SAMN05519104_6951 [Rhizobiales bacterium GAS188]
MLALRDFMERPDGWGRDQGRKVYPRLLRFVEDSPGTVIFKLSMKGVHRLDISFASETIVELARRYRRTKGFCLIDLTDRDLMENIDAAAARKEQPIMVWHGKSAELIGAKPSEGTREAFQFVMGRGQARATEFAAEKGMSIANASMKFKQLWEQGFLLRRESAADSGGVEYVYQRIA